MKRFKSKVLLKESVLVCSYNAENTIRSNYFNSKSKATQMNVDFRGVC